MNIQNALSRAVEAHNANPTRPATLITHDSPDARVVVFRIERRQQVAVHTSPSSVVLFVLSGHGMATGADGEEVVRQGDVVLYAPHEPHGFRALDDRLIVAAVIAPRPGERK